MKQWFVAHTQPLKEIVAQHNLVTQGFDVYLPRIKKLRKHARKIDEVHAPLFPRYLFVGFDLEVDRWNRINGTRGVSYLVSNNHLPTQIPDQIILDLKSRENIDGILPVSSIALFSKGDRVRIIDGAFKDHKATFDSFNDKERVQLLLTFLGREIKVSIPPSLIEST